MGSGRQVSVGPGGYPIVAASTIRRLLRESRVAATDRRARFVGIEAYTEAGGDTILHDLFGGSWLQSKCQEINIPSLSIIGPVMQLFQAYLGHRPQGG